MAKTMAVLKRNVSSAVYNRNKMGKADNVAGGQH